MAPSRLTQTATVTSEADGTEWVRVHDQAFDYSVGGISGDTVSLQRKRRGEADSAARDWKSFTADTEDWDYCAGDWLVRLWVKTGNYSAGTIAMLVDA